MNTFRTCIRLILSAAIELRWFLLALLLISAFAEMARAQELTIPFTPIGASGVPIIVGADEVSVPVWYGAEYDDTVNPPYYIYKEEDEVLSFAEYKELMGIGAQRLPEESDSVVRIAFGGLQADGSMVQLSAGTTDVGECNLSTTLMESMEVPSLAGTLWDHVGGNEYVAEVTLDMCYSIMAAVYPSSIVDELSDYSDPPDCITEISWLLGASEVGNFFVENSDCDPPEPADVPAQAVDDEAVDYFDELTDGPTKADLVTACIYGFDEDTLECLIPPFIVKAADLTVNFDPDVGCPGAIGCSPTEPDCPGPLGCMDPGGEGPDPEPGEGVDICVEHPDALACEEVDGELVAPFEEALGDLEELAGDIQGSIDGFLGGLTTYVVGIGPDLGPAPEVCPLISAFAESEIDFSFYTEPVCEVTGGPLRQLISILSVIAAMFIIIKGASA